MSLFRKLLWATFAPLAALCVLVLPAPDAGQAQAQEANWFSGPAMDGSWTLSDLNTYRPASSYCFMTAWVSDRPGGAGMMVSNCSAWVSNQGPAGAAGATGATGSAGVNSFGSPTTRTLSLATAYQATNTAKPAIVTVNITSTANLSLSGGTTNSATVLIGSTNAVASGTGTIMCPYSNSSTGSLTIGLNTNTISTLSCTVALPTGWYFAIRQTAGTVTITSAFDQQVG